MFDLRPLLALLAAISLTSGARADTLQPEDFAWGQHLLTSGSEPFYRLALPEIVYRSAAHADLRDIRVYNSAGEQLPFALVAEPHTSTDTAQSTPLQAWHLPGAGGEDRSSAGHISVQQDGLQLSWSSTGADKKPQLLLVVPGDNEIRTLSSIRLDWQETSKGWQQSVSVESSNDLQEWTPLASDLPLLDLQQAGQRLIINTLRFPESQARYWRLTLDGRETPTLKSAVGEYHTAAWSTALAWLPPQSTEKLATTERIYRFALPQPAAYPRIHLPQDNSVLPYRLDWRRTAKDAWQPLPAAVAWRLTLKGQEQESPWRELDGIEIGELRLRAGADWGAGEPTVELGRRRQHLLFNARGTGPWLLTWGAAAAGAQSLDPQTLIPGYSEDSLQDLPSTTTAEAVTLGGEQRRLDPGPAERQARWQTRVLWLLLVIGAGGLAWLALKLWRDMPRTHAAE